MHRVAVLVAVSLAFWFVPSASVALAEDPLTPAPVAAPGLALMDVTITPASVPQATVRVALPAGTPPPAGWPVLILLPGSSPQPDGNRYIWEGQFADVFALAARDHIALVMPEAGKAGYHSNWNSGPSWETFHLVDVPNYLRAHHVDYPIDWSRQAIGGFSMGGLGALSYAARHPGRFRAVIALSPVANPLRNPSVVLNDLVDSYGSRAKYNLWGSPKKASGKATWKKHDPYYRAKGLRGIHLYLYAGTTGRYERTLRAQTIKLAKRLKKLGVKKLGITLSSHTGSRGTHAYPSWRPRLVAAWPGAISALKAG